MYKVVVLYVCKRPLCVDLFLFCRDWYQCQKKRKKSSNGFPFSSRTPDISDRHIQTVSPERLLNGRLQTICLSDCFLTSKYVHCTEYVGLFFSQHVLSGGNNRTKLQCFPCRCRYYFAHIVLHMCTIEHIESVEDAVFCLNEAFQFKFVHTSLAIIKFANSSVSLVVFCQL